VFTSVEREAKGLVLPWGSFQWGERIGHEPNAPLRWDWQTLWERMPFKGVADGALEGSLEDRLRRHTASTSKEQWPVRRL